MNDEGKKKSHLFNENNSSCALIEVVESPGKYSM